MCLDNSGFVEAIFFQVKGRWVIMQNLSNQGWFKSSFMTSLKRFYCSWTVLLENGGMASKVGEGLFKSFYDFVVNMNVFFSYQNIG